MIEASLLSTTKIEDVIEAKKVEKCNVYIQVTNNCRYAYSAPSAAINETCLERNACNMWMSDGELHNFFDDNALSVGSTDSEITVVRVKREGLRFKSGRNNWDLNDDMIPGDGTHLGESPSMVNLVTLVAGQSDTSLVNERSEYLVPLSSWDPIDNPRRTMGNEVDDCVVKNITLNASGRSENVQVDKPPSQRDKKNCIVRRIAKFFRSRFASPKTLARQG